MPLLQVVQGLVIGQQYHLKADKIILGRHPACEIVLDVGAVSRQHAQITREGENFFVEDLKSRNGTLVNDALIEGRRQLAHRDEVKICDVVFTYYTQPPEATVEHFPGAMLVDDPETTSSSTIMSKLDVSTSHSGMRVAVNPEVKLRAMLDITQNLAKSLELGEVLPKILDSLFKIFVQADRGFVVLRETPGGPLIPKAMKHRRADADETVRISRTIVNEAMNSKQAILSADAANDAKFGMSESIADFRIRSMMCAPLIDSEGQALGVIQIDTLDQRTRFQQEDLDLLASVASQAAFAVENAKLHETSLRTQAMERDLQVAHRVQQGFLPSEPPQVAGYEFFDYYVAANQVGGDYYDYVPLPDRRIAVIVADVAGKGISAALLMAKISAEARYLLASERNPAVALMRLNASFSRSGWEDRFVTLVLCVIDLDKHEVTIVNAGHMPPLLLRHADGSVEDAGEKDSGVPLGVDGSFEYTSSNVPLLPGDSMTAFTDGISEAMNDKEQLYGTEKIREQLRLVRSSVPAELGNAILDDVKRFVGKHPQSDDMCLLCFSRTR